MTKIKHGHTAKGITSGAYRSWDGMIGRCLRGDNKNYAGRGITVCDRWRDSFSAFLSDMGDRPHGTSLDRINNDGNYEPGNCRWATTAEQSQNNRRTVLTASVVSEIRAALRSGDGPERVASNMRLPVSAVRGIASGESWANVPDNCSGVASLGASNDSHSTLLESEAAETAILIRNRRSSLSVSELANDLRRPRVRGSLSAPRTRKGWVTWLAHEIATHDHREVRDATAWSWDPSRPIAEQLAETARDDADAATVWRDWAKDNMISHEEYEALRAAEPDCRDEDEPTDPTTKFGHLANQVTVSVHDLGAKDPNEDAMRDPAVTAHNAEVIAQRSLVASPEVCACTGDALLSEKCEVAS